MRNLRSLARISCMLLPRICLHYTELWFMNTGIFQYITQNFTKTSFTFKNKRWFKRLYNKLFPFVNPHKFFQKRTSWEQDRWAWAPAGSQHWRGAAASGQDEAQWVADENNQLCLYLSFTFYHLSSRLLNFVVEPGVSVARWKWTNIWFSVNLHFSQGWFIILNRKASV